MNVVIIEDEKLAAYELQDLLQACDPSIRVLAVIDSVKAAVEWLQHHACDLIFLDIHLADDSGFRIFEQVKVSTPVIFTTAYDRYALKAFTLNSIDYLLKPVETDKLNAALLKFKNLKQVFGEELPRLMEESRKPGSHYQQRFMVQSGERTLPVMASDIGYFYAQHRYVVLFTLQNQQYVIDHTLDKLEQLLDPAHFFRINRQFIISSSAIKSMSSYTKGRLKIELQPASKEEAVVSVDRSPKFKLWINY